MNRQPGSNVSSHPLGGAALPVLLKATALALIFSVILLFVAALVLYFTAVSEKITPYVVFGISLVAILWSSSFAGRKIGARGWVNGGAVGILYVVIMLVIGLLVLDNFTFSWNFFTKIFLGFIFGAAGGMWGVNN
jgi:putative membrane protein (TIGR04086 family)